MHTEPHKLNEITIQKILSLLAFIDWQYDKLCT